MKARHAGLALAATAAIAVPVLAQTIVCDTSSNLCAPSTTILGAGPVMSGSGAAVSSGTGVVVTPGAPNTVAVVPAGEVLIVPADSGTAVSSTRLLPGGVVVAQSSTTVLSGPPAVAQSSTTVLGAAPAATTRTVVTRYWVNVPAGVENRADFQRWLRLR